jgi:hypothetical protein
MQPDATVVSTIFLVHVPRFITTHPTSHTLIDRPNNKNKEQHPKIQEKEESKDKKEAK